MNINSVSKWFDLNPHTFKHAMYYVIVCIACGKTHAQFTFTFTFAHIQTCIHIKYTCIQAISNYINNVRNLNNNIFEFSTVDTWIVRWKLLNWKRTYVKGYEFALNMNCIWISKNSSNKIYICAGYEDGKRLIYICCNANFDFSITIKFYGEQPQATTASNIRKHCMKYTHTYRHTIRITRCCLSNSMQYARFIIVCIVLGMKRTWAIQVFLEK